MLRRGEFDLVAIGRAVLADLFWAGQITAGRLAEIRPYAKSADGEL